MLALDCGSHSNMNIKQEEVMHVQSVIVYTRFIYARSSTQSLRVHIECDTRTILLITVICSCTNLCNYNCANIKNYVIIIVFSEFSSV